MLEKAADIVPTDSHTGVTGPVSPFIQLLSLKVEMDLVYMVCLCVDSIPKAKGEVDDLVHHKFLQWAFNLP